MLLYLSFKSQRTGNKGNISLATDRRVSQGVISIIPSIGTGVSSTVVATTPDPSDSPNRYIGVPYCLNTSVIVSRASLTNDNSPSLPFRVPYPGYSASKTRYPRGRKAFT